MYEKAAFTRIRILCCVTGFATLFSGIAIYVFFRNHDMVLFHLISKPTFLNTLFISVKSDSIANSVLLFNLPDGLWFLSGLLFIRALWLTNAKWRTLYFGIFAAAALALEIGQIFPIVPGTFDALDVLVMGIFAFMEISIFNLFIKRRMV
jgi:hypothetical protein